MRMTLEVVPAGTATATVVLSQAEVDAIRGAPGRGRVPLSIAHEGRVFRTSISVYRGRWMMVVNRAMRDGGLTPPGIYEADVSLDTAERTVDVPDDLGTALAAAGLRDAFDRQSYTKRKEFVRGVMEARKPETRERRVHTVIAALSA